MAIWHTIKRGSAGRYYAFSDQMGMLFTRPEFSEYYTYNGELDYNGHVEYAAKTASGFDTTTLPLVVVDGFRIKVRGDWDSSAEGNWVFTILDSYEGYVYVEFKGKKIWAHKTEYLPFYNNIELCFAYDYQPGDQVFLNIYPYPGCNQKINIATYGGLFWITGQDQPFSALNGRTVIPQRNTGSMFGMGDFMVVNKHHLIFGKGRKIWWSGLQAPGDLTISPYSDADYYLFSEEVDAITNVVTFNDRVFVFFPEQVYEVTYVGAERGVYRIEKIVTATGAVAKHGVVVAQGVAYFLGLDNFYAFDGRQVVPIGTPVFSFFLELSYRDRRAETWCYFDGANQEVNFCFATGDTDFATCSIFYSLKTKTWSIKDLPGVYCHVLFLDYGVNLETATTTSADVLITQGFYKKYITPFIYNVFGSENKLLVDSEIGGTPVTTPAGYIVLNSEDFEDLVSEKEIDTVYLDADYDENCEGLLVEIATKQCISEKDVWETVGVWKKELFHDHLDFPAKVGKVFKIKISPIGYKMRIKIRAFGARLIIHNNEAIDDRRYGKV